MFVEGEIDKETLTSIDERIRKGRFSSYGVAFLNSPGGDVVAALAIGRIFRRLHVSTYVLKGTECTSSCVFLLVGSVYRVVDGRVGLHRPYYASPITDYSKAAGSVREMERTVQEYFDEMDVPRTIYDRMRQIAPENVEYVDARNFKSLGIPEIDPSQDQLMRSLHAKKLGLTMSEYTRRATVVAQECNPLLDQGKSQDFFDCRRRIFGDW
jgi:hypothetical protein